MESLYEIIKKLFFSIGFHIYPLFRRILRFVALPYCFYNVNWNICPKSRPLVLLDFLYIFFFLKYYPDNYSACRLWEKPRSEWKFYYGSNYDPYQRKQLQREVQRPEYEIIFKDKRITDILCNHLGIPIPKVLGIIKKGQPILYCIKRLCYQNKNIDEIILKPVCGKGGEGIIYAKRTEHLFFFIQGKESFNMADETALTDLMIQQFIKQHPRLARISGSTNTVRIVTLLKKNCKVLILGAYMRFGTGDSKIDNLSQGGISVGINLNKGQLKGVGRDRNSFEYEKHPDSEIRFDTVFIPHWMEMVDLACNIQKCFAYYRLLGMDIAITADGPVLIEINSSYDNVDLEQAIGPILSEKAVLNAYKEFGLLISRRQKKIVL